MAAFPFAYQEEVAHRRSGKPRRKDRDGGSRGHTHGSWLSCYSGSDARVKCILISLTYDAHHF